MEATRHVWAGAILLAGGAFLISGVIPQKSPSLEVRLDAAIPGEIDGYRGQDTEIPQIERRVAGFDEYLMRVYEAPDVGTDSVADAPPWVSVYAAYYESQARGRTIHSPKNCMPGAGWEALESRIVDVEVPGQGPIPVNRYILTRETEQVLVFYWYQGRGRVAASEYRVKWDLLRDAALKQRSDEALVRVVVPISSDEESAVRLAARVVRQVVPALYGALPG